MLISVGLGLPEKSYVMSTEKIPFGSRSTADMASSAVRSTSGSEQVSPTPVMPVMPDNVRLPKFQLRRRRVCATTSSPRYQIDCQVTERSLKSSEAVKVPQPLNRSIQMR